MLTVSNLAVVFSIVLGGRSDNMVQGLAVVKDFLKRPYIQTALMSAGDKIKTPQSVLSFFYGVNYDDPRDIHNKLVLGNTLPEMAGFWYGGGPDYDACCQTFDEMIRQAGTGKLLQDSAWSTTTDGLTAQLILCDQLSRNAFRGTPEAFAYDEASLKYAHTLTQHILSDSDDFDNESKAAAGLSGIVYPPYVSNVITALMHSESSDDHEHALELIKQQQHTTKADEKGVLRMWWDNQLSFEQEHKQVIDRFGRYPHRNKLKGRETTPEEQAWLDDKENLPGWAKSQG